MDVDVTYSYDNDIEYETIDNVINIFDALSEISDSLYVNGKHPDSIIVSGNESNTNITIIGHIVVDEGQNYQIDWKDETTNTIVY